MLMMPANDIVHMFTTKGKHPMVSINSIKNSGAYLKGQSPRFYIVPGEPVVVASAVVSFPPYSHPDRNILDFSTNQGP